MNWIKRQINNYIYEATKKAINEKLEPIKILDVHHRDVCERQATEIRKLHKIIFQLGQKTGQIPNSALPGEAGYWADYFTAGLNDKNKDNQ